MRQLVPDLPENGAPSVYADILEAELRQRLSEDFLRQDENIGALQIMKQRFISATGLYAHNHSLAGDQQVILAFVTFCKLTGHNLVVGMLEELNQEIHSTLHERNHPDAQRMTA